MCTNCTTSGVGCGATVVLEGATERAPVNLEVASDISPIISEDPKGRAPRAQEILRKCKWWCTSDFRSCKRSCSQHQLLWEVQLISLLYQCETDPWYYRFSFIKFKMSKIIQIFIFTPFQLFQICSPSLTLKKETLWLRLQNFSWDHDFLYKHRLFHDIFRKVCPILAEIRPTH